MKEEKIYIATINDYLDKIGDIDTSDQDNIEQRTVYFRGETDCYPHVQAGIYRIHTNSSFPEKETKIIEMTKLKFPEIIKDCSDDLDALVRLQHYSLPTRLLDVTTNPLVALFFACFDETGKNDEKDGRVLTCTKKETPYEQIRPLASLISGFKYRKAENIFRYLERKGFFFDEKKEQEILLHNLVKPHLFAAPQNNPRMRFQNGAFVFSPLRYLDETDTTSINHQIMKDCNFDDLSFNQKMALHYHPLETSTIDKIFDIKVFVIFHRNKANILSKLDELGINEASIYPDYEHQMRYIKNHLLDEDRKGPQFVIE